MSVDKKLWKQTTDSFPKQENVGIRFFPRHNGWGVEGRGDDCGVIIYCINVHNSRADEACMIIAPLPV